jgi:hypothetical protein
MDKASDGSNVSDRGMESLKPENDLMAKSYEIYKKY